MKRFTLIWLLLLAVSADNLNAATAAKRPNIILIMADDLGFSDIGCYGSEIKTPNLDKLASNGLRFTQFYNTAKCHSSRVSLLTGLYCDQAGGAKLNRGATIAEVLGASGYVTNSTDCDDDDEDVNPDATETCDDVDNDCDGSTDEAGATGSTTYYEDDDGDGYGNSSSTLARCSTPGGYVTNDEDCDDGALAPKSGFFNSHVKVLRTLMP